MASSTAKTNKLPITGNWRVRTLCAGALALAGVAASVASGQTIEDEQRALARAKAQAIVAEERASQLETLAAKQLSAAEAVKARAAAVAARIQAAESDVSAAEARISLIERLRADQRARLAEQQEPAIRLMAALQSLARRPPALAFIQPGSVSNLAHVRAVLAGLIPRLRARTAALRAEIARGKSLRVDADSALAVFETSKSRLEEQRRELLVLFAQRKAIADKTTGSALAEQDRAMAMGEKARDIVELLGKVSDQGEVRDALASLPGPMLRPLRPTDSESAPEESEEATDPSLAYRMPVTGTVATGMGEISSFGVRSRGLTLVTRPDAQIVAPSAGQIVFAGKFGGYGNVVIIDHGKGWTSVITALALLDVAVGDSVLQGSPVGRAARESPRITVELRQKNQPVDIASMIG